ncbi:pyridoxamine 5'-phosphate oxidase family protein [Paucilactobacillus nenjiangensis]|nr:pyridoxamine 5'-phosphate oxidase family protein [Paucilactobacillus nenjiangensis]
MRRQERQIDLARIKDVVESNHILRLGMLSEDYPYVVPVNYGYEWLDDQLVIYIHGARQGKKISSIKANPKVCIEMDHDSEMISGGFNCP